MPDRTLVQTPQGEVKKLTVDEFVELEKTTFFKKNVGHEKVARLDKQGNPVKDKNGKPVYKAGKPNGWLVEQGGYPPLAFGFSGGLFYIKANSDRKWLTDKDDRCNANPGKTPVMKPLTSEYKASTIAYKLPFADFPERLLDYFPADKGYTYIFGMGVVSSCFAVIMLLIFRKYNKQRIEDKE